MEEPSAALQPYLGLVLEPLRRVVATLPGDMRSSNPYDFPWEFMICVFIFGFFAVLLFLWRGYRSVQSRLYVAREKKLAAELSILIEEKCKLLEKFSLVKKEYEGLESSLKDASFGQSTEAQRLKATYEKLERSKSEVEDEILVLEKELEEEKSKHSEQDDLKMDISERIQSLEDESKSLKSQIAEAQMTFKIFQMNEERLKTAIKDAFKENAELQESQKQLSQDAEEWKERLNELNKQKIASEDSKLHAEQVLNDKDNQIKSLTEHLLKMKHLVAVLGEDLMNDDVSELEMKSESETGSHIDDQPRGALKKLIHAAKLNASLKTLEGERKQIYIQLSEIDKTKEELSEYIKDLQAEQSSLQSENTELENENQKLNHKLQVITELYEENEVKLHRKLTVEENCHIEKQRKLCKADEKLCQATEEMETYRQRAKDLEEELERTILSYQQQSMSQEKKANDNWLVAQNAERKLNDLRKDNAYNRRKLTEAEFKYELLGKDPYVLDAPNTFGREHSPYGPSPLGRPSSETRAFLSPPTLLEGPLRLSPLIPGGGGRGSRGPGNPLDHQITNERGETSYDRSREPHRAPSDPGSLSPPWEQERRMIPPPGQPYPDPSLYPQPQDIFYSNPGRRSGPAELRHLNMPSMDIPNGPVSSEMVSRKTDPKDNLHNLNAMDSALPAENKAIGHSFVPPPPVRGPLFPMDPRGFFMRRGPPVPPPPPGSMYGAPRDYLLSRHFPGPPPPPVAMRNVNSPRAFPPRFGFYPPPSHPENRNELSTGLVTLPNEPATKHTESQET